MNSGVDMDDKCLTSCIKTMALSLPFIEAITTLSVILMCLLLTFIVNKISKYNNNGFEIKNTELFYYSAIIYGIWNVFLGLPMKDINVNGQNDVKITYKTRAISYSTSAIFAILYMYAMHSKKLNL